MLAREVLEYLQVRPGGRYLDATLGAGGHSRLILEAAPDTQVLGIDRDEMALETAGQNLAEYGDRVSFWRGNFAEFPYDEQQFDGIRSRLVLAGQFCGVSL